MDAKPNLLLLKFLSVLSQNQRIQCGKHSNPVSSLPRIAPFCQNANNLAHRVRSPDISFSITQLLPLRDQSTWSFLIPFKSAAQVIPRPSLVAEMLANTDVARFVTALLPNAIKNGYAHRTLVAFNATNLHDYITRSIVLDQGLLAFLLPALLEPLHETSSSKDCIVSAFLDKCYH
jgi:hypothetical protein